MNFTTSAVSSNIAKGMTQGGGFLAFEAKAANVALARDMMFLATLPTKATEIIRILEGKIRKGYTLDATFSKVLHKARSTQATTDKLNKLFPKRLAATH